MQIRSLCYCILSGVGAVVFILSLHSSALAEEVWRGYEGKCGEWQIEWRVNYDGRTHWIGEVHQKHIGGSCVKATGQTLRGRISVDMPGETFTAQKSNMSDGNNCSYAGTVFAHAIAGTALARQIGANWEYRFLAGQYCAPLNWGFKLCRPNPLGREAKPPARDATCSSWESCPACPD
jgi:hypothetical protein